jgi:hypothetical protein
LPRHPADKPSANGHTPNPAGKAGVAIRPAVRIEDCIPALRRYALALLRDRDRADDLVHDYLMLAIAKPHKRRDDADMRAWLFTILHKVMSRLARGREKLR